MPRPKKKTEQITIRLETATLKACEAEARLIESRMGVEFTRNDYIRGAVVNALQRDHFSRPKPTKKGAKK